MEILRLDHYSVIVQDLEISLAFYRDVLGLEPDGARPDMAYRGAWFTINGSQIHLIELSGVDPVTGRPAHVGCDRHIALRVRGTDSLKLTLASANISFTLSQSGRRAVFFRDPDGNGIECIEA